METTHQTARDYARLQIYSKHMRKFDGDEKEPETTEPLTTLVGPKFNAKIRNSLYEALIENRVMSRN